jgi:predicted enzyme related to lactoylglutathione lyase
MTYFATTDVDGAAARASGAGGTLLHGPEDTPFGRMATLADPEGAVFSLVGVDA